MIIDITSFTSGPRQIENAVSTQSTSNQIAVAERINAYIEFYQPLFLQQVVSKELQSQIEEYSATEHEEEDETMKSIIDLLKEPLADYVFFYMLRDMNTQSTITGLVLLKCANTYVSPLEKGVQTWNRMVDELEGFVSRSQLLEVDGVHVDRNMLTYINPFNL